MPGSAQEHQEHREHIMHFLLMPEVMFSLFLGLRVAQVVVVFASTASSLSLMKASQAFCSSSCSVVSAGSGKSFRAGEVKVGILGNLDRGSTLE